VDQLVPQGLSQLFELSQLFFFDPLS
jgi:hypothetical protein